METIKPGFWQKSLQWLKKAWKAVEERLDGNKAAISWMMLYLANTPEVMSVIGSWGVFGKIVGGALVLYANYDHYVKKKSLSRKYK
jgi:hypothetical protein